MRAGIYERISLDREGRELGVERQHEDNLKLSKRIGAVVAGTYRDNDRSASTRSRKPRPEYQRLVADARAGHLDVIIAYTTGRLTRRPREHEDLIDLAVDHGIQFRFVASPHFDLNTAAGRRIARTLAAQDAGEAEDIAERVTREHQQRAENGRHPGGPRGFGFGVAVGTDPRTGKPVLDHTQIREDEAAVLRGWYETILGGGSISGIRQAMSRCGVLSVAGRPWHDSSIRAILLNERNAGLRYLRGAEYKAANPPIVPEETYLAVKTILENPGRRTNHDGAARKHLGAGLFLCQRCPKPVGTGYEGTAAGKTWRTYECRRSRGGCGRSWKAEPIDTWISDLIAGILAKEDARRRLLPKPRKGIDTAALRAEALAVRKNMAHLAAQFAVAKGATQAALAEGLRAGEVRLDEIDARLAEAGRTSPLTGILLADDPAAAWRAIEDVARRQAVVGALMTVTLGAPIRGRAAWDPRRFITIEPKA